MAATLESKNVHKASVPWTDVDKVIADNAASMLSQRPTLSVGGSALIPGQFGLKGLSLTYSISPQKLDEILRAALPALPTLGLYDVLISSDPTVAFEVSWADETVTKVTL